MSVGIFLREWDDWEVAVGTNNSGELARQRTLILSDPEDYGNTFFFFFFYLRLTLFRILARRKNVNFPVSTPRNRGT